MQERNDMLGAVTLQLTDGQHRVVHRQEQKNRIVRAGRELVAKLFGGVTGVTPPTHVTHMAVGSDATPPADNQTALLAERAPRKAITEVAYSDFDELHPDAGSVRRVRATLRAMFDFNEANDPKPLREAAIYTSGEPGSGVMYNRVVFDPVTKTEAFQLTLLWEITF